MAKTLSERVEAQKEMAKKVKTAKELAEEGWTNLQIAEALDLDQKAVRHILNKEA